MGRAPEQFYRPLNRWDFLIGICFGVQLSRLGLETVGLLHDWRFGLLATALFTAAVFLQIERNWGSRPDASAAKSKADVACPDV